MAFNICTVGCWNQLWAVRSWLNNSIGAQASWKVVLAISSGRRITMSACLVLPFQALSSLFKTGVSDLFGYHHHHIFAYYYWINTWRGEHIKHCERNSTKLLVIACMAWYRRRHDYNIGLRFGACLCISIVSIIKNLTASYHFGG